MAIRHCDHSTSLTEFLLYTLVSISEIFIREEDDESNDMEYKKLLTGKGLGKILKLCGEIKFLAIKNIELYNLLEFSIYSAHIFKKKYPRIAIIIRSL